MEATNGNNQEQATFTPEEWELYTDALWGHAYQTEEEEADLRGQLDSMDKELEAQDTNRLDSYQKELRAQREAEYWALFRQLQAAMAQTERVLGVLDGIETGETTPNDILEILPENEEQEEAQTPSKARLARRQFREALWGGEMLSSLMDWGSDGYTSATDPRRIASGRNRTQFKSSKGLDPVSAQEAFMMTTTDTHGGKVRRPGKSARTYVSGSGKRIRKR